MNRKIIITLILTLFVFNGVYASDSRIKNKIRELEKDKQQTLVLKEELPVFLNLPNGKKVNLKEWQLVVFIQSTCKYCQKFDPIIEKISKKIEINTFVFSFDGMGDSVFKNVYPVTNEIVATFYRDLPVATPTVFLVNVNNLTTAPVSQGEMSEIGFENQIIQTFMLLEAAE